MTSDSDAGMPPSPGMRIGFLLAGSPEKARVYAVLAALPLLEGVSTVRLAWADASQAEFSGLSSFSASPGELIDRLSNELLHLPGFRVQIQGVNRVPYPILVFRAEPGETDHNAVRRRSRARSILVQQEEAQRGTPRIEKSQTGTQPGRTPGAGITPELEDAGREDAASEEAPTETTWALGRMALTVREPGFENVLPRLRPATRSRPDPIEPVVRSHYPRPSPVVEAGQSAADTQDIPGMSDADWLIELPEEAEVTALTDSDEGVPQDAETIGAVAHEPGELPEEEEKPWQVLVSDFYPDLEHSEQLGEPLGERSSEQLNGAMSEAGLESEEVSPDDMGKAAWQRFIARGRAGATRNRPRRESLWNRVMSSLFGEIGPDSPVEHDADESIETGAATAAQSDPGRGDQHESETTEPDRPPDPDADLEKAPGDAEGGNSPV